MATLAVVPEVEKMVTSLKQVGVRRDYQMIDPRLIDIEKDFNPRRYDLPENRAHLDELKRSISEIGLIQPLIVRFNRETGRATVVDGESRLRSIMELIDEGHPILSEADIPCFPAPQGSNDEAGRLLTAITANTGKPLSKWELGGAFQRLFDFGLSPEKIMGRTGYTERFIREAMELADAPQEIKELLSAAAVTPSLALATIRANGSDAAAVLKQRVEVAKVNGQKTAKRDKAPTPTKGGKDTKNVSNLVLYAAEEMAKAIDGWLEDATPTAETKLVAAHKAYRKLIRSPRKEEAA
jgi:ParB-like chromosome segregation protein Spo0J